MDINTTVIYSLLAIVGSILFLNFIKIFINIFTKPKMTKEMIETNKVKEELRSEISTTVKPHLTSLEGMYEKSDSKAGSFSAFVLSIFKDKFSTYVEKNEKLLESEISKCCDDYEGAECKESFCLEGSGIACPKS